MIVLRERGGRKKNEVIVELLKDFVEQKGFTVDPEQLEYVLRIEEERETFLKLRDELIRDVRYNGKYIAVFQGSVLEHDEEKGRLAEKVYREHGYVPIYIDRVSADERRVEIPSPELTHP